MSDLGKADDLHGADGPGEAQIRTFLIADVRGYTLFTQEHGDEAAAKLAAKFADIARDGVEARGGTLLELRGDEALCVFTSTREAIRAALDLQERFVRETLDQPELPLTVGIGLDAGEAVPVQGGYRGGALNLAARLCGQARAGEILASREVTHLARRLDGVRYEDRGTLSLKGLADPVVVIRIVPEGDDPVERLRPFTAPPPVARKTSRRWAVAVGVALVLALVAISVPLLRSGKGTVDVGTNSIARMNADDESVDLATALGQRPGPSAIGFGSLWVAEPDRGVVARLDLEDGSVTDAIRVGNSPAGVAIGEGSVWVTNSGDGTVSRINVETNEPSQTLHDVGTAPSGIAFGDGALWIADAIGAQLLRVDPASGESQAVALAGQPSGVAFTPNGVWVSVAPAGVARIDPSDLSVTLAYQSVGNGPTAVLLAFGSIWVANHLDRTVTRIEPSTGRVEATIEVGEGPNALGAAADSLWVGNEFDDSIVQIDPATNAAEPAVSVGGEAASLVVDGDGLWLAVGASATEHRGGTLTVSSEVEAPASLDPAVAYDPTALQILSITNDGLLSYKKVGGPDGNTLVPDLAAALPEVSADGLTYRFPLRAGIRYSTGDLVRPEDFRHAIERSLSLPESAFLFRTIVGTKTCRRNPSTCDLSPSIVAEAEAVTFHLARPDPDLLFKLALPAAFPVPVSVPARDQGLAPVPATGPYMIAEAGTDRIRLVRNPRFREWSAAGQPDGFVDEISWRFNEGVAGAYDRLDAGELDWMTEAPQPVDLASLQATHPSQVVPWPQQATIYVGMNIQRPPFDNERVRQALNYAIDRDHVVELLGGPANQRPTCQIVPPNFPGYEPFCPYTLEPNSGVWSAPDLARAQALIEDAGAAEEKVAVLGTDDLAGVLGSPSQRVATMRYVVDVLNELGLRAELKIVHTLGEYGHAIFAREPQAYLLAWFTAYPRGEDFIGSQFRCGASFNIEDYCSKNLDAQIENAQRLQATDPADANRAWIGAEHRLVEAAVWAPLTNPVSTYAFSARVENVQVHPQWGILLSRLWVQ